tara:strand:+ start:4348 stop:4872 length:525 start_codon:yes stop_codon:yes gene_type:complete
MTWAIPASCYGTNIPAIPYTAVSLSTDKEEQAAVRATNFEVGAETIISVTSSLNLDLTVNPNFSQVEVDEQQTNLTRFDLNFPEINNNVFTPHLLLSSGEKGTVDDFLNCFMSINSVQAFGWREGTVLDGLWQLYALKGEEKALTAIKEHFDLSLMAIKTCDTKIPEMTLGITE